MGHDEFKDQFETVTLHLERKLASFMTVTSEMVDALRVLCLNEARFARDDTIIASGEPYQHTYLVQSGWGIRYKLLPDGERQIVNFVLPGDFMCFNAALFPISDFCMAAQTELVTFVIPIMPLSHMLATHPQLALALSWANAHEESLLAERIVSLGRRTARQRMAHLFCELWRRLQLLDMTDGGKFPLPLTQEDLADTLGLSTVHINRTLRSLRTDGLIENNNSTIQIVDMAGLERLAGFDDGYLHFTEMFGRW